MLLKFDQQYLITFLIVQTKSAYLQKELITLKLVTSKFHISFII